MAELVGSLLVLAGSLVALLAAIGVARFPDAFMRMHAATKAGVIATGLCIAGVALALGEPATWTKGVIAIALLLATTPIASHVLGRAAWRSGADITPATRVSAIEAEMPRVVFDAFPEFRLARAGAIAPDNRQEAAMNETATKTRVATVVRHAAALDEVLLAVAWHPAGEVAAGQAAAFAAASGARLTIVSLVDSVAIEAPGPVPLGGLAHARRLDRTRLARARERAAEAARVAARYANALGVDASLRHAEGKPCAAHFACDRARSLVVMAADSWFDHGVRLDEAGAAASQCSLDAWPLLLVRGENPRFERLLFLHDGGIESRAALSRLVEHPLSAEREFALAGIGSCSEPALHAAAGILSGRGRQLEVLGRFPSRDAGSTLASSVARSDVLVLSRTLVDFSWTSFFGLNTWRIARQTDRPMLLF